MTHERDRAVDPRKMTPADLAKLGMKRVARGTAIRQFCLDCMGGSPHEVLMCASGGCPLWPFRMGTDPWRTPQSEEQRAASAERLKAARA